MPFAIDTWLLPAVAAGAASYLISLAWEKFRKASAPSGVMSALLAALSFVMGAICAAYRHSFFESSPENNIIVMFFVGALSTYFWLLLRRYLPGYSDRDIEKE